MSKKYRVIEHENNNLRLGMTLDKRYFELFNTQPKQLDEFEL